MELITGINDDGRRLDRILRKALPDCPLPLIHRLLRQGKVQIDGKPAKAQTRVEKNQKITIPEITENIGKIKKKGKSIKVSFYHPPEILWQDDNLGLIAFNKPAGLAVHGHTSLDRMAQAYLATKLPPSLSFKPGPLHRLDKPTSGIVVFSKSLEGAVLFTNLMKNKEVKKTYLAIVEGELKEEQKWEDLLKRDKSTKKSFISGSREHGTQTFATIEKNTKKAITIVVPFKTVFINSKSYSLIKAEIETGRTHQIRSQASHHGHPLAQDNKYGGKQFPKIDNGNIPDYKGFYLHAWKMEFSYNDTEYKITSPLPDYFKKIIDSTFQIKMS